MIWAVLMVGALVGGLMLVNGYRNRQQGRLEERLSSSQSAVDAAKVRADVENINTRLSDDDLRDKLRPDRNG